MVILYYKGKMNRRNNKILITAVFIGKDLIKIGVREPKVAITDDIYSSLSNTNSKQIIARWCYKMY